MRKIILSTVAAALIAASASQAVAAPSHRHARKNVAKETAKETAMSEQVRNARNALTQPSQPVWPYSGWSAPAGR
ncbi:MULTISPECIES: hypothetical protein [Bradyrhizobium]|jgi:hypothetical protein|uniref:hypothetical protein n=1 Tax=Bradyrhizobium TaxID=374 RepID=UPI00040C5DF3|nr:MULTISPECIES: hypothetical protein [Bradyrhizobium]QOG17772.1 hypothetical protein FOM02_10875 [Bradyrhizobium sp. SEMIA]UFW45665.1 hypothetical protein BaraCB756_25425 [Bradyrhizobium arachidis]